MQNFILNYRIPIGFGVVGFIFLILSILVIIYQTDTSSAIEIVQTTDSHEFSQTRSIFVDIEGAIENPGVYEMPENSRVSDLLSRAGELSKDADSAWVEKNINKAQVLVDGAKIYIPAIHDKHEGAETVQGIVSNNDFELPININTASADSLKRLDGIGEKTSEKIIAGRPYSRIEELEERGIVGQKLFETIKDSVSVF